MMLNDQKYKQIVNEWFARLEKGYAQPPYTKHELKVLDTVLQKHGMLKSNSIQESKYVNVYENADVDIDENIVQRFIVPVNNFVFSEDEADPLTPNQLNYLRSKIESEELKTKYSKYLSVFYYFAPNALGEISEILLVR